MDNGMFGLSSFGERKSDMMSKEDAIGLVGRYREMVNKGCDDVVKAINTFPGDMFPWAYAVYLLMSCVYAGETPEGGSND